MIFKKKNKKGFIGDYIFYMVYIFIIAIFLIVLFLAYTVLNDNWQDIDGISQTSKNILDNYVSKFSGIWDWIIIFWVIGFIIVLVIIGLVLRSHPVFASMAMIAITIVGGMISVYLGNAYENFISSSGIATAAASFPKVNYLFSRYPHIVVILSAIFIIVLFSKNRSDLGI